MVSFISAPMSKGWPADCAKASDGCGEVVARRATTWGESRVSFWASSLRKFRSRSEMVRTTIRRPLISGVSARRAAAWAAGSSSCGCWGLFGSGLGCSQFVLRLLALFAQRLDLVKRLAGLLRDIVNVRRKERGAFGERGEVSARGRHSALPGDEFDAPSLTNFFGFAQQNTGNLSGLRDVRAAAGRDIEVADVDEAEFVALGGREFAQAKLPCFVARHEADVDGTVLEDDLVG